MHKRIISLVTATILAISLLIFPASAANAAPYIPFTMGANETADDLWSRIKANTQVYTPGLLADGTPITEQNINRMIDDILAGIPDGSTWDESDRYFISAEWPAKSTGNAGYELNLGGCNSYARLVSDYVFGYNTPVKVHKDFQNIKPGDLVYVHNANGNGRGHWYVMAYEDADAIQAGYTGLWHTFSGNTSGKVFDSRNFWEPFDSNLSGEEWTEEVRTNSCVITRYGDEVGGGTTQPDPVDPKPVDPDPQPPVSNPTFSDVPASHWAFPYVERAAENGWVSGVGGGKYQPDKNVTYSELATMLTRILCPDTVDFYTAMKSAGDPWYQPYLLAADAFGLWQGTRMEKDFTAAPDPLTRYEMAAVLAQAYYAGEHYGGLDADPVPTVRSRVGDWSKIPGQYQQAVAVCVMSELLSGTDSAGTFSGGGTMTRAQAAVVACRAADIIGRLQSQI